VKIIDSHMHCGIQNSELPIELIRAWLDRAGIQGACLYPPVEDIYNRDDYHFEDNARWVACRQMANEYLLEIQQRDPDIHAYYFVWNDFRHGELKKGYRGIKWHRHEHEPVYHYDDPGCEAFIAEAIRLQLPIVLEESFQNTLYFIKRIAGRTPVIIPHLGGLNGGFRALFEAHVWNGETVYADTALASTGDMEVFLKRYGSRNLLFGSDFPFGIPSSELSKVQHLRLKDEDFENVVNANILRLIGQEA
jgi:predicted TIM-barrel fold metal-dependent hydrolase